MDVVRIGCVRYLNTLPLIEGLRAWRGCELVEAVPSALIGMLERGDVDVALCSVVDAVNSDGVTKLRSDEVQDNRVTILPVGMIGSDGPTFTVRVYSRVPIERITRVGADTDSHTSIALMRVVLRERYGVEAQVVGFEAKTRDQGIEGSWDRGREGWPEAVLLIGDKVVTDPPPDAEFPHQLDLGEAWKDLTGLPFVYAVWMCRAGEEGSPKVRAAAAMLDRARRHNRTRLGWIVDSRAGEKRWAREDAAKYLGESMRYEVGEREHVAMDKFFEKLVAVGEPARA